MNTSQIQNLYEVRVHLSQIWGTEFKKIRTIIYSLSGRDWHPVSEIIQKYSISHKSIFEVLSLLSPWLESKHHSFRIKSEYADEFKSAFGSEDNSYEFVHDYYTDVLGERNDLIESMSAIIQNAPRADINLDHVSATPETCIKRAIFLAQNYDILELKLLFLGDHDLTSVALAHICPHAKLIVVDIDERLLNYVSKLNALKGWKIQTLFADLRVQAPRTIRNQCDLVFTDPPYTPIGIDLFLERGFLCTKQTDFVRALVCYGFNERQPMLGFKVQSVMHDLRLVTEAILPSFNRYIGAQAVGSSSSLYICRPTRKTWPAISKRSDLIDPRIYTHGESAEESGKSFFPSELLEMANKFAIEHSHSTTTFVENASLNKGNHVTLNKYIEYVLPSFHRVVSGRQQYDDLVAVNLFPHYGAHLFRVLSASHASDLLIAVANNTLKDIGLFSMSPLVLALECKYKITVNQFTDRAFSIVVGRKQPHPDPDNPTAYLMRYIFDHQQATLNNAWREALVTIFKQQGRVLTKNQAREVIEKTKIWEVYADTYLSELPVSTIKDLYGELNKTWLMLS